MFKKTQVLAWCSLLVTIFMCAIFGGQAIAQTELQTITPPQSDEYLANPAVGWQEAHTAQPLLPESIVYKRPDYGWVKQNPSPGVYDWSAVDADLNKAVAQGKQFAFRIYTMKGESYGGHQIPQWAMDKGISLINGAPDYSNCVYQEEWGIFVNALRQKYDGNPHIAYIDISGYGNFNEWSWTDGQTEWDDSSRAPATLDGQARKRLADMFIGGSGTITCRNADGSTRSVSYSYPGFQKTQLVLPYAGVRQSNEYVFSKRKDVGMRNDCLGRAGNDIMTKLGGVIAQLWPHAPIIFEFCGNPSTTDDLLGNADTLLKQAHGSIARDNFTGNRSVPGLQRILKNVGYRYTLKQITLPKVAQPSQTITVEMIWHNLGYAPNYPKMGQTFSMKIFLVKADGTELQNWDVPVETHKWLPAAKLPGTPPDHKVSATLSLIETLPAAEYDLKVALIEQRTSKPINVALEGRDQHGRYPIGRLTISTTSPLSEPDGTSTLLAPSDQTCPADLNQDQKVNWRDFSWVRSLRLLWQVIRNWGQQC
jgi:hypothetical protein